MMIIRPNSQRKGDAFTLEEVLMSMAVASISMAAILSGYLLSFQKAEWAAHDQAAQALAVQRVEQTKAARWEPFAMQAKDELNEANFPDIEQQLYIPVRGTNVVNAMVYTTITDVSTSPPIRRIRADAVWSYMERGPFTNTVITLRSPDQ